MKFKKGKNINFIRRYEYIVINWGRSITLALVIMLFVSGTSYFILSRAGRNLKNNISSMEAKLLNMEHTENEYKNLMLQMKKPFEHFFPFHLLIEVFPGRGELEEISAENGSFVMKGRAYSEEALREIIANIERVGAASFKVQFNLNVLRTDYSSRPSFLIKGSRVVRANE